MCIERYELDYKRTDDMSVLFDFYCGIDEMDRFIRNSLQSVVDKDKELETYIIQKDGEIVGLTAIKKCQIKIKTQKGYFYPDALEIEYLAVRKDLQRQGIGKQVLEWIEQKTKTDHPKAIYLSVGAYVDCDSKYSAAPFYRKKDFLPMKTLHPMSDRVNMIKKIIR